MIFKFGKLQTINTTHKLFSYYFVKLDWDRIKWKKIMHMANSNNFCGAPITNLKIFWTKARRLFGVNIKSYLFLKYIYIYIYAYIYICI